MCDLTNETPSLLGDCDSDNECEGDLVCYKRGGNEDVPGCLLGVGAVDGKDYCVSADSIMPPSPPSPPGVCGGEVQYVFDDGDSLDILPLSCCQGTCDVEIASGAYCVI